MQKIYLFLFFMINVVVAHAAVLEDRSKTCLACAQKLLACPNMSLGMYNQLKIEGPPFFDKDPMLMNRWERQMLLNAASVLRVGKGRVDRSLSDKVDYAVSPLNMLGECDTCELDRSRNNARKIFERYIITELEKQTKYENHDDDAAVTFASLGAGRVFQECVILTKLLSNKDSKVSRVRLVLIDSAYKLFLAQLKKNKCTNSCDDVYCREVSGALFQMIRWFDQLYPGKITCYVFSSLATYSRHIQRNPALRAHVYMGCDLEHRPNNSLYTMLGKQHLQYAPTQKGTFEPFFDLRSLGCVRQEGVLFALLKNFQTHLSRGICVVKILSEYNKKEKEDILVNADVPTWGSREVVIKCQLSDIDPGPTLGIEV